MEQELLEKIKNEDKRVFLQPDDLIPAFQPFMQLSQSVGWGLLQAGIPEIHKTNKGAGIKVAVLDTGGSDHAELAENIVINYDCTGHSDPMDRQGHGTHVAGIIAAKDNDFGVLGVAPEAKVYCMKVLDNNGRGGYATIEAGLRKAMDEGVDIINMSLGAPGMPPESFHEVIREAYNRGIFIIAAAGNDGQKVNWPAAYDEVIAIGAINENGDLTDFSSRGVEISVIAPGDNIYSTWLNNGFAVLRGTSQAAPFVAGICALMLSACRANPELPQIKTLQDLYTELNKLCDPKGRLLDGKDGHFGFGIPKFPINKC
jgi:subtilisin family serine protease